MAHAEAVILQFPPQGTDHDLDLDEDGSFLDDMMEKEIGELFCDFLMFLMGIAILSLLVLVTSAAWWASVKLFLLTKAMI